MTASRISALALMVCLCLLGGCSSQSSRVAESAPKSSPVADSATSYVMPAKFLIQPVAERDPEGGIYVSGTTNFPDGMKLEIVLGLKQAEENIFVDGGKFRTGLLFPEAAVSGRLPLEIISYFNRAWQSESVLSVLGEGGKNLRGTLFRLKDPDVVDSDKVLDAKFILLVPPVAPDANAISIVKQAILTVPGKGTSASDIEDNIKLFESPGTGVLAGNGWSATRAGADAYTVSYAFIDGPAGEKEATWSVNVTTKQVKYVNEAAKAFSWTPNY